MIEDERRLPTCSTGICGLSKYGPAAPFLASAVAEERSIKADTITSLIRLAKPAPTSQAS
jgi:hypothetical protein